MQAEQNRFSQQELLDIQRALEVTAIVAITDSKGIITYVNDKFCEISLYSREELVGQNHRILNSGHHPRSFWTDMYSATASGLTWTNQICNRAKGGSLYWVDTTIVANKNQQGKIERYIAIRTDITVNKILEQSLLQLVEDQTSELRAGKEFAEQAQAVAEAANHAKSDFLANMSHELRTPMHSIISFSKFGLKQIRQASLEQKGIEKIDRFFSNINDSAHRLLGLLNNLLDLSKLEAGKMEHNFKSYDVTILVNEAVSTFSSQLDEKKITIAIDFKTEETMAYCDNSKIMQVLINLIANAIKFTAESSAINISLDKISINSDHGVNGKQEMLLMSIIDQGIGIPDEELATVFDYFIQSSKTDTGAGGTGLGLAICKEIIEAHNSNIWMENNKEGGATVRFALHKDSWFDNGRAVDDR